MSPSSSFLFRRYMSTKRILITTPIFYVNAAPHLGHLYSATMADALSRWFRFKNQSTVLTTGTDEHGLKVQEAADKVGLGYQDFCNQVSKTFKDCFDSSNIQYDDYIRTSEKRHKNAVHAIWNRILQNGHIYLGNHTAWYSKSDEAFLTEKQVQKVEQPDGTVVHVSMESNHIVEKVSEENYKFRLSTFQKPLLSWLDNNPSVIYPKERFNEVRAIVANGLQDVSVSRLREKVQWAIPVPNDDSHAIYVWLDALTNYITASGYPNKWNEHSTDCWPADYHIVGKDILKFHAIYWPAFLMAAGLPLPKRVVAHAHWTVGGVKMSKSLGNVVQPKDILDMVGIDRARYFLLRDGGLVNDGDFSMKLLEGRSNTELADTFGNLISRCTALNLVDGLTIRLQTPTKEDQFFIEKLNSLREFVEKSFEKPDFSTGLSNVISVLQEANRYFQMNEPWKLAKLLSNDKKDQVVSRQRLETILYISIEACRLSALCLSPVIPDSSKTVLDYLKIPKSQRSFEHAYFGQQEAYTDLSPSKFVLFDKIKN